MNRRNVLVFVLLAFLSAVLILSAAATSAAPSPEIGRDADQSANAVAFRPIFSYSLEEYWVENNIAVADYNKDGRPDIFLLATTGVFDGTNYHYNSRLISLRNDGGWTFSPTVLVSFGEGSYGYGLAADDMDSDGWPDLVVRENWNTHVLLNEQNGEFRMAWSGITGAFGSFDTGDLNGDGWTDFVSGIQTGEGAKIESFLNAVSDFTYHRFWESPLHGDESSVMYGLSLAKTNDTPHHSLVALVGQAEPGVLLVYSGHGDGSFTEAWSTPLPGRAYGMGAGDVDGDAYTDVAVAARMSSMFIEQNVKIFTGNGDNSMSLTWESPGMFAPLDPFLTDFNFDGYDDLFFSSIRDGEMRLYLNDRSGGFGQAWYDYLPGIAYSGVPADLDNDGTPELIMVADLDASGQNQDMMLYIYDQAPVLSMNYLSGAPGSFFQVSGSGFPAGAQAAVAINGHALGTVTTDAQGALSLTLDAAAADEGYYTVSVSVNPTAALSFRIDAEAPLRPQGDVTVLLDVPAGIAHEDWILLAAQFK